MNAAAAPTPTPSGLRILMVEDEMMLAMSLEDLLTLLDCRVIKAARLTQALALAKAAQVDGALLDINLNGDRVYAVADELDKRGIPFAFMTGYAISDLESRWQNRTILQKPFLLDDLANVLSAFVAPSAGCSA